VLRIGVFARLGGTTAKVLRDYDQLGLFRPAWVDPFTSYRAYSPAQLPQLRRILALRGLGVGLVEIQRLAAGGADLAGVLARRRAELEVEREEIERRLAALDIHLGASEEHGPDVVVRRVVAETVAALEVTLDGRTEVGAAFYELETWVRDHGQRAPRPPGLLLHEAAAPRHAEVFVPLRRPAAASGRIVCGRLPAARAATMIHHGSYESMPATRAALDRWVAAAGLAAVGPLRVLYLQFGAEPELDLPRDFLVDRAADYVTELQLPIG